MPLISLRLLKELDNIQYNKRLRDHKNKWKKNAIIIYVAASNQI